MNKIYKFILLGALSTLFFDRAYAFPNMIRHGYTTCLTCHYNASGGGTLRDYGKYVAGETMGFLNTSDSALGWIKKLPGDQTGVVEPERYSVSFLGRTVQYLFDLPQQKTAELKKMQADVEAAFDINTWIGLITAGPRLDSVNIGPKTDSTTTKTDIFLRRYFVGKQDLNYSVKIGKFFPEYGINLPNHNVPTRKSMFFNHNQEPYALQASYFTTTFDYTLAYIRGTRESSFANKKGASGTLAYKNESSRFGVSSILYKAEGLAKDSGTSLFATIGYGGLGYTMFEVARKNQTNTAGKVTSNNYAYLESGWELSKGLIPFFAWQYSNNVTTHYYDHRPTIGVQFAPITHFEVIAQAAKLYTTQGNGYSLYSMFNVYF